MTLRLNSRASTAASVDVKGIQVGVSEELDKLYLLRGGGQTLPSEPAINNHVL